MKTKPELLEESASELKAWLDMKKEEIAELYLTAKNDEKGNFLTSRARQDILEIEETFTKLIDVALEMRARRR